MLRKLISLLMCLTLLLSVPALATDDDDDQSIIEEEYRYIESMFNEATSADEDYWEALSLFKKIVKQYEDERYKALQNKDKAFLYYSYAQGVISIELGEYEVAAAHFAACGDLAYAKEYTNYANGMLLKQNGEYRVESYLDAIAAFDAAMKCDHIAGEAGKQRKDCLALYKESILMLGDEAFEKEDYETALGYYEKLMNLTDPEGMKKYNVCLSKLNQTELPRIEVTSETTISPTQVEMAYTTKEDTIAVSLHMQQGNPVLVEDLLAKQVDTNATLVLEVSCADDQGWELSGLIPSEEYTIQFNGLLPDTNYWVRLATEDQHIVIPIKTDPAPQTTLLHVESVTGRHYSEGKYKAALQNLKEGASIWTALIKNGELPYTDGNDLIIGDGTLGKEEYCLQLRMGDDEYLSKADIAGKVCQLIMHVDEIGTVAMEPSICGEENCPLEVQRENDKYMMVKITDVLNIIVEKYPGAAGNSYSMDCLLDGDLLFSINGSLK